MKAWTCLLPPFDSAENSQSWGNTPGPKTLIFLFLQKLVKPPVPVGADPVAAFAEQTPARKKKLGSTGDAAAADPRPAPQGAEPEGAEPEEAGAPAGAWSQVTTVTTHLLTSAKDKKCNCLLLQVDAEAQEKEPSSATGPSPPRTGAQLPQEGVCQSELKAEKRCES